MPYRRPKSSTQIRCTTCRVRHRQGLQAARTDSPASSSRFRSRTAEITWVESVRCLPPAPTRPSAASRASSVSSTT